MLTPQTFDMYAGEVRLFALDWGTQQELVDGETIATAVSLTVDRAGLKLSTNAAQTTPIPPAVPTISTDQTVVWISGIPGEYVLTFTITTSGGATLKDQGRLVIHPVNP